MMKYSTFVGVRPNLNPSQNNLFFDIISRHFNTMAHENVNILLLNYAHKYLRHTQIQKRTINKAAKIL